LANLFEVHLHKYVREWQQTPEGHDMYKDFEGFTVEGGRAFEFPALNKTEAYEGFVVRHLTQHVRALGGEWKGYASGRGIFEALPNIQSSRFFTRGLGAQTLLPMLDELGLFYEKVKWKLGYGTSGYKAQLKMFTDHLMPHFGFIAVAWRLLTIYRLWIISPFTSSATNKSAEEHAAFTKKLVEGCKTLIGDGSARSEATARHARTALFKQYATLADVKQAQTQDRWKFVREQNGGKGLSKDQLTARKAEDAEELLALVALQEVDDPSEMEHQYLLWMAQSVIEVLQQFDERVLLGKVAKVVLESEATNDSMPVERIFKMLKPLLERQQNTLAAFIDAIMTVRHGDQRGHLDPHEDLPAWLAKLVVTRAANIIGAG
jgi:hypothetical protein